MNQKKLEKAQYLSYSIEKLNKEINILKYIINRGGGTIDVEETFKELKLKIKTNGCGQELYYIKFNSDELESVIKIKERKLCDLKTQFNAL